MKRIPLIYIALLLSVALAATVASVWPARQVLAEPDRQEQSTAEEQLAAKYVPIVYVREQDEACDTDGEAFEPVAVELVLDNPDVTLKEDAPGRPVAVEGPTASDLFERGEEFYLEFPGNPSRAGCDYEEYFRENAADVPRVAYAHIARERGRSGLALQYWFFYYFNDWNNTHEGDWEMIQLVFEAESAAEALTQTPLRIAYSQHNGGETADWDDDKLELEGDHPLVYAAKGAHSNFYDQATFFGKGEQGTGFGCDDTSSPSRRVELEARLAPAEVTDPEDPFAWLSYEGRWGEKRGGHFSGPTGPSMKDKWTQPFTWEEGLRNASVRVPETTIFPNSVGVFCAVVQFGSAFLLTWSPFVLLGVAVVTGGATIATARRTRFAPVVITPIRQRRHFGQILRGAFRLLRQRRWLFLGIGVIFVPVGLIGVALQSLTPSIPAVDPVLQVIDSDVARGLFALALGALQMGFAYWLVIAAVTAAMGVLDAGRRVGVGEAYRLVWDRLWTLLRARLRALVVIVLLSLTLVGIPWALRRAVNCLFLEHAILLEGQDARGAAKGSTDLVRGSWWRVLGVTSVLLAIGLGIGPLVGIGLVLLTSASLAFINLVTALIYLAFIPWVAVGFTMLYYDLKEAGGASPR